MLDSNLRYVHEVEWMLAAVEGGRCLLYSVIFSAAWEVWPLLHQVYRRGGGVAEEGPLVCALGARSHATAECAPLPQRPELRFAPG